jgi:hypothetical protein
MWIVWASNIYLAEKKKKIKVGAAKDEAGVWWMGDVMSTSLCVRPTVHYIERERRPVILALKTALDFLPPSNWGDALVVTVQQLQSQDPKSRATERDRWAGWGEVKIPTSRCPLTPVYRPEIYNENLTGDAIILFIKQKIKGPCENEQMRQRYPQRNFLSLSLLFWNRTRKTCALLQKGSNASCP